MTRIPDLPLAPRPNALALWALILGIAALILSLVVIGGAIGIPAFLLAIVAITKPGRKGFAISGLVTGILSLPIAFFALLFWIGLFVGLSPGRAEAARRAQTEAELSNLKTALFVFEVDVGRFPTTAEGLDFLVLNRTNDPLWRGPYVERIPTDPWGHVYIYRCPDGMLPFDLFSTGHDGDPGTPDDITAPRTP